MRTKVVRLESTFGDDESTGSEPADQVVRCGSLDVKVTKSCCEALKKTSAYAPGWVAQMGMIYKTAAVVVAWLRAPYILEDDEHQIGSLGNGLADMASSKLSAEEKAAVNLEAESYLRQGIFEIQDLLQQPDKGIKERAFDPRLRDLSFVQSHTEECLRLVTPLLKNWLVFLNLLERRYFGRKWVLQEIAMKTEEDRILFMIGDIRIPWAVLEEYP
ncbi:hypothetical protein H2203_003024 [Taxawa tesnikishii (nom. ined.)]|nr:hypothetical protein H2203_003024 [Dothideales sp. JES 119]